MIPRRRARASADRASRTPAIKIARAVCARDRSPPLSARGSRRARAPRRWWIKFPARGHPCPSLRCVLRNLRPNPLTRNFCPIPDPSLRHSQGEKKSFGEWLLNAAVRDSGVIGAGYENELKNGQYKGSKKKK